MDKEICLLVMDGCEALGSKVNEELKRIRGVKTDFITPVDIIRFSDGEGKAIIKDSIRNKDVYIISDTHNYGVNFEMYGQVHYKSPDEHFMDIVRAMSAMMGHASSVKIIMPFLYQSRQHRRKDRESLDCAISLKILEMLGVNGIISFDVHDVNIQNAIPLLSLDNFYPTNDILKMFLQKEKVDLNNLLVISPDFGAIDRAKYLAKMLSCDMGVFYKQRDITKVVNGKNPIKEHKFLGDDVTGKTTIIIDDMIASGGSMIEVAEELKKRGASKVYVFASFSLFTEGIRKFDEAYKKGTFDAIYSTNLNYVPEQLLNKEWFNAVDFSSYLAKVIDCLNRGDSISQFIEERSILRNYKDEIATKKLTN